jgi:hypothetical protein
MPLLIKLVGLALEASLEETASEVEAALEFEYEI